MDASAQERSAIQKMVTKDATWHSLACKLHEGRNRGLAAPVSSAPCRSTQYELSCDVTRPPQHHHPPPRFFEVCVSCVQKNPIGWLMFDVVLFVSVSMACFQH